MDRPKPSSIEKENVHEVYEHIATHFSETRYKPWPLIDKFLKSLADGSLVADIGCGNGKYMSSNEKVVFIGSDRSHNLAAICAQRGFQCSVADNLALPFRSNAFNDVISIAVLHHFSSVEHRIQALKELNRIVKPGGRVLVTVWAFEQEKHKYSEQDVMIPWKIMQKQPKKPKQPKTKGGPTQKDAPTQPAQVAPPEPPQTSQVFNRYYHLFKKGELDGLFLAAGGFEIDESVWDCDNWYVTAKKI